MDTKEEDLCNICLEEYNKIITIQDLVYKTGNKITCIKCEYSTCTHCTKKYLLSSNNDAHCMSCKHNWDREFLINNITKVFVSKEYKLHRENTLCDREKSLLPSTMKIIEKEQRIKQLIEEKNRVRIKMQEMLYTFDIKIWDLQNSNDKTKKNRNKFIKKCSVDGCNGFLSSQWKCGICETFSCNHCHEIIGKKNKLDNGGVSILPHHECNSDNVKTAILLSKECKNCPKCATPIYKIDGCNQMWCIECKTAFDWRTTEIITGNFHNPHYYEWLRQNNNGDIPREPGDEPCGGNIQVNHLRTHINKMITSENNKDNLGKILNINTDSNMYCNVNKYNYKLILSFIESLHRECEHITFVTINDLDRSNMLNDDNYIFNLNVNLRKSYLKGIINEKDFKTDIQKKEKKRLKALDKKQIYHTLVTVCNDIFRKIINNNTSDHLILCLNELITFINMINKQFIKHKDIFNCVVNIFMIERKKYKVYSYRNSKNNDQETRVSIETYKYNNNYNLITDELFYKYNYINDT